MQPAQSDAPKKRHRSKSCVPQAFNGGALALERRDFAAAKQHLLLADQLAISDEMQTLATGMDMVLQYNTIFWNPHSIGDGFLEWRDGDGKHPGFCRHVKSKSDDGSHGWKKPRFPIRYASSRVGCCNSVEDHERRSGEQGDSWCVPILFKPEWRNSTKPENSFFRQKTGGTKVDPMLAVFEEK